MQIELLTPGDDRAVRACVEVTQAVAAADDPAGPPDSERAVRTWLLQWAEPTPVWFVPGESPGSALAICRMRLPDLEERDRAILTVEVHPAFRRRGIGLALLRHAARQAAEHGRTVLGGEAMIGSAGEAFARRTGATPGLTDARRVLVLGCVPPGRVASLRDSAARAAAGYSLVSWAGRTPDEYAADVAGVLNAMNDMPRDAGREDRVWDVARVRARLDDQIAALGHRAYNVAAVHAATGEMAALTRVSVDPEIPEWGHQLVTAVTRAHRGHRLGMLLKATMLERLAVAEKALGRIVTWNAASNKHMIDINEALGYELLGPQARSYELSVADVASGCAREVGAAGPNAVG